MKPEARLELVHGPYHTPAVKIGEYLECELRGWLKIRRFSSGRIAWPMGHPGGQTGGRHTMIVCGDLARAIRAESGMAMQCWWGVSESVITRWRHALGIEANNTGTRHLRALQSRGQFSQDRRIRGGAYALRIETIEARRQRYLTWLPEEAALLGTMPDTKAAEQLGRPVHVVRAYRAAMGILPYRANGPAVPIALTGRVALAPEKVLARRLELGLIQKQVAGRAGLSEERYGSYERYLGRQVEPNVLERLAAALQCSPEALLPSNSS